MIITGHYDRQRREDEGTFECPKCNAAAQFAVYRTYQYFHVYFIPLIRQRMVKECVKCEHCGTHHAITVLGRNVPLVGAPTEAANRGGRSIADNFGNVIVLTDTAANEIVRLRTGGRFADDIVVRIMPDDHPNTVMVKFDFALADGSDWIGESRSIPIVVDRRDAPELLGCTVDFRNGDFCRSR